MKIISKKQITIVTIIIGLLVIIISILSLIKPNKNNKVSVKADEQGLIGRSNREIVKDDIYNGIKFTNNSLITENGYTVFTSDVINISDNDITNERYHLYLKNKDGEVLGKLLIYIPHGLKKGESKTIKATAGGDYKDAYSKEIKE